MQRLLTSLPCCWASADQREVVTQRPTPLEQRLVAQLDDHLRVTLTQSFQGEQVLSFALPVEGIASGLDAVLPARARVARVTGQKHGARRCPDEIGDVIATM